jgi:murein DD-endopeptidase MepM/ murein hydrolase activator NlpD
MRNRWIPCAFALLAAAAVAGLAVPNAGAVKFGQRTLKQGMRGHDVRVLQKSLTRLKLPTRKTGYFGGQTTKKVRRLETRTGWQADGRVQRAEAVVIKRLVAEQKARKRAVAPGTAVFPVPGTHNFGGAEAQFGAPRSGHSHQGQDVFAACGERLVAAQAGNVSVRAYQAAGAGYYLVIDGTDGFDYVYMHLAKASWAVVGTYVPAGTQIGQVGQSGNASGCHLHFEMWTSPGWFSGGAPVDPLPYLLSWDAYS